MAFILYEFTFTNGKKYIGQTVRKMSARLSQHRASVLRGSKLAVHCAWRKHGEPSVHIIGEYESAEALHAAEIAAIAERNTLSPNGYNLGYGGETAPSKNPSVARKISESNKGRSAPVSNERRSEITAALWASEEYRKNRKAKAIPLSTEQRLAKAEKMREVWAKRKADGWKISEETKAKLRKVPRTAKQIEAVREANKRRKGKVTVSDETRAKIAAKTKAAWQDKELSARRVAAIKAAAQSKKPPS